MIDTLIKMLPQAEQVELSVPNEYILVTLHRPSNTDDTEILKNILTTLADIAEDVPVIFPIHPRTRSHLSGINFDVSTHPGLHLWEPVGYLEFLHLQKHARLVITDSGGIQEETTYMQIPCLTVRENTERPVTVTLGTNQLVGQDMERLRSATREALNGSPKPGQIPPLWDGKTGERIANILVQQGI